jgi:transcriptional/translational regulatory protein YebC/TACO1
LLCAWRCIPLEARANDRCRPSHFQRLQSVISKAKAANMTKDKIDAAIKRGVDSKDAMNAEAVLYEASGPGGSALMVRARQSIISRYFCASC